jgi:transposase
MVKAVRQGASQRETAKRFRVSLSSLQYWLAHAGKRRLDRVDWSDKPRGQRPPANRTSRAVEDEVLRMRVELRDNSLLGEFGAAAIRCTLLARNAGVAPSVRTIGRILERCGALDGRRRLRRPAPPPGWYLPALAARDAELDSFDFVESLKIRNGPLVDILNGISLHGGLPGSWPLPGKASKRVVEALVGHWQAFGCPTYAQFDNDTCFQGPHQHPDTFGRVTRLCLSLGVIPVFVPPAETGFQAAIENFNGRWQTKIWDRFQHTSLEQLQELTARYLTAYRARSGARIEAAPRRRVFPQSWSLDLQAPLRGRVCFIRRTDDSGYLNVLGHPYLADRMWLHRLVRAEVDLTAGAISFHGLRRRDPSRHVLLNRLAYKPPATPFQE